MSDIISFRRLFGTQPEPIHHPGSKVLDHHIRQIDQLPRRLKSCTGLQVELDPFFPSIVYHPFKLKDSFVPRPINLHHIRTLIRQQHPRKWPGHIVPKIHHPNTFEWPSCLFHSALIILNSSFCTC